MSVFLLDHGIIAYFLKINIVHANGVVFSKI